MKNLTRFCAVVIIFMLMSNPTLGQENQNSGAGIRFDLNATVGNQNQTTLPTQPAGTYIQVDVYVVDASNLDAFEFDLNYPSANLTYLSIGYEKATPPPPFEYSFLNAAHRGELGWDILEMKSTGTPGLINYACSLEGDHGDDTPDGEGLLATIWFESKVAGNFNLTFGDVDWFDNAGFPDVCSDANKGIATLPVQMSNILATSDQESGNITVT